MMLQVKGSHAPRPIKSWPQCGLGWKIMNVMKKYDDPLGLL